MTLAADGHLVKVHKMVMSLVSPYIKELISSAECSHPVVFLNQVSYQTLCSILEYVYTGEVLLAKNSLNDFINAGKALHIRGLTNMNVANALPAQSGFVQIQSLETKSSKKNKESPENAHTSVRKKDRQQEKIHEVYIHEDMTMDNPIDSTYDDVLDDDIDMDDGEEKQQHTSEPQQPSSVPGNTSNTNKTPYIQYSVSNQGNLQMVLNRYLYYLVYTGKNSGHRRWQCIDNHMKRFKCPAAVVTKNGVIVQRISAHNHSFHDQKILKKVQTGAIFSALHEAQNHGKIMQKERNAKSTSTSQERNEDSDTK
ncbi:uncharacterized protein LOC115446951 isoform X2 [Manduca sexta]|nr:uncharacterized protein LOC115446951 isoform X2 [Manduca sexta]